MIFEVSYIQLTIERDYMWIWYA